MTVLKVRWAFFVAAIILAVIAVVPIAAGSGVPMLLHDWSWPAAQSQVGPFARSGLFAWHTNGLGDPMTYPSPWLPYIAAGVLCSVFGVHGGLVAMLFAMIVTAYFSTYRFARTYDASPSVCAAAALVYESSPIVLNLVHAGHWIELVSYALLPLALASLRRESYAIVPTGVLLGISASQFQYVFIIALVALVVVPPSKYVRTVAASAIAMFYVSPEVIVGLLDPHNPSLDAFKPYEYWTLSQGSTLLCAVRSICYIGYYDTVLGPWISTLLFVPPLITFAGYFANRKAATHALVLIVMGTILASGAGSPLRPVWLAFYDHVTIAAVFRENYHFSAVTALGTSLGLAVGLQALTELSRAAFPIASSGIALLAALIAPLISTNIPMFDFTAQVAHVENLHGRFALYPSVAPWRFTYGSTAGFVPLTLSANRAVAVNGVILKQPLAEANAALRECLVGPARRLLERAGIAQIVRVPNLESSYPEAALNALRRARSKADCTLDELVPHARLDGEQGTIRFGSRDDDQVGIDPSVIDENLSTLSDTPDPAAGWSRVILWPSLPSWVYTQPEGIFTTRPSATLAALSNRFIAGNQTGDIRSDRCSVSVRLDSHFSLFACDGRPTFRGTPPLVVARGFTGVPPTAAQRFPAAPIQTLRESSSDIRFSVAKHARSLIVLHDQFDKLWTIDVPAKHVRIDDFYNGWILESGSATEAHIRFVGELPLRLCLAFSIALLLGGIAVGLFRLFQTTVTPRSGSPLSSAE